VCVCVCVRVRACGRARACSVSKIPKQSNILNIIFKKNILNKSCRVLIDVLSSRDVKSLYESHLYFFK